MSINTANNYVSIFVILQHFFYDLYMEDIDDMIFPLHCLNLEQ